MTTSTPKTPQNLASFSTKLTHSVSRQSINLSSLISKKHQQRVSASNGGLVQSSSMSIDILPCSPSLEYDPSKVSTITSSQNNHARSTLTPRLMIRESILTKCAKKPISTPGPSNRRRTIANLDFSGIGPLSPDVSSTRNLGAKKKNRRSNICRDQFLSFVFQKEASPPKSASKPIPKLNFEILSYESASSDEDVDWEMLRNSGESTPKVLPKSGSKRKFLKPCKSPNTNQSEKDKGFLKDAPVSTLELTKNSIEKNEELNEQKNIEFVGANVESKEENAQTRNGGIAPAVTKEDVWNVVAGSHKETCSQNIISISNKTVRNKRKNEFTFGLSSKRIKTDHCKVRKKSPQPVSSSLLKQENPVSVRCEIDRSKINEELTRCPTDPTSERAEQAVLNNLTDLTQKAHVLTGTVIYVDFRSDHENRGNVLKKVAKEIGATVVDKFTAGVTHVIFKDGSKITYQKAKKAGIHIVSAAWLERSRNEGKIMPEAEFPSVSAEKYDTPGLFPKIKKMKSMQPKTLFEDFKAAERAYERKQKMIEKKILKEMEAKRLRNPSLQIKYPPHEHYYKGSPHFARKTSTKSASNSTLNDVLKEIQSLNDSPIKFEKTISPVISSPKSPSDTDFDTPLARRLANKYQSPAMTKNVLTSASSPACLVRSEGVEKGGSHNDVTRVESINDCCDTPLKLREVLPKSSKTDGPRRRQDKSSYSEVDNVENTSPSIAQHQNRKLLKFHTPFKVSASENNDEYLNQTSSERGKKFVLSSKATASDSSLTLAEQRKRKLDDSLLKDEETCHLVETPSKRMRV